MIRRALNVLPVLAAVLCPGVVLAAPPEKIAGYQEGLDALAVRLWDVAAARFEGVLNSPDLEPGGRPAVLLRLAETRIRAGDAAAALTLLADPALAEHPERRFWQAQAHAANGQFHEALVLLDDTAIAAGASHRQEAILTRAALLRALGRFQPALEALALLSKDRDAAVATRARLESAEILLSLGRAEEALTATPPPNARMTPLQASRAELLRGRAQLERGEAQAAAGIFSALLAKTDAAAAAYHPEAAVGLARAQIAGKNLEAATDGLLAFIETQRDSPKVGLAFPALLECLPAEPAADDVILTRLREWCPPPVVATPILITPGNGVTAVWPAGTTATGELAVQALYHLALGLRSEGSDPSKAQARRLLTRVRLEYPEHPLAERALLETARWDLAEGRGEQAAAALAALDGSNSDPALRAEASLSAAASAFATGNASLAADELAKAAALLDGDARREATLNAAVARLTAGELPAFEAIAARPETAATMRTELSLERALWQTSRRDPAALQALDRFLMEHPAHPRVPEARLAAAIAAMESAPPDAAFAKAQLESLSPEQAGELSPAALALTKIRLAGMEQRWTDAAALARAFLEEAPQDPRRPEFRFELGRALYENDDFNDARLQLAALAAEAPASPQAEAALLLAARASALVATPEAKQESIVFFDRVIARKGELADAARLMKALTLPPDATAAELLPWFQQMKKDHPLRLRVGLDLGDALYNSAGNDPAPLTKALEIYESLLAALPGDSDSRAEIEYLRGKVLEQLPDPKAPTQKREAEALEIYFSVLQAASRQPPSDWRWVDLCGRRALSLLENAQRWEAAISIAELHSRLGSPDGPRAKERADALKMKHFIWDEK